MFSQSALAALQKLSTRNLLVSIPTSIRSVVTKATAGCDIFNVRSMEDFEKKVKNCSKPIIVDFFATWCHPCKTLTPRLESIIGEQSGDIQLAKVDIDELGDIALNYNVSAVPVLLAMKDGKVLNRMIGLQDTKTIRDWIEKSIEQSEQKAVKRKTQ